MRISASQNTYNPVSCTSAASPSFKGGYAVRREIAKRVANSNTGYVKFLTKLGRNNGEILNTIVTALGTAIVAPIFIAFNPFSKEDKETKTYSALRQPISAIIAFVIQIFVNLRFNKWLDHNASTGRTEASNLLAKPQNSYLKSLFKLTKPGLPKQEVEDNIQLEQDKAFEREYSLAKQKLKDTDIKYNELIDSNSYNKAKEQLEKELKDQKGKLTKKELKAQLTKDKINERAALIVKAEVEKDADVDFEIKRITKEATESKKEFSKVLEELNDKHSELLRDMLEKQDIKYEDLVDPNSYNVAKAQLEQELKANNSKLSKRQIKKQVSETRINERAAEIIKSEIEKGVASAADIQSAKIEKLIDLGIKDSRKTEAVSLIESIIEKLTTLGDFSNVKSVEQSYERVLQNVKIKKVIRAGINNAEDTLKANKKWGGILLSLVTLPFSCGLLNWAYPRIMEKIMPEASNAKKAKEAK